MKKDNIQVLLLYYITLEGHNFYLIVQWYRLANVSERAIPFPERLWAATTGQCLAPLSICTTTTTTSRAAWWRLSQDIWIIIIIIKSNRNLLHHLTEPWSECPGKCPTSSTTSKWRRATVPSITISSRQNISPGIILFTVRYKSSTKSFLNCKIKRWNKSKKTLSLQKLLVIFKILGELVKRKKTVVNNPWKKMLLSEEIFGVTRLLRQLSNIRPILTLIFFFKL